MSEMIVINTDDLPPEWAAFFDHWKRQTITFDGLKEKVNLLLQSNYNAKIKHENGKYHAMWWGASKLQEFTNDSWLACFQWLMDNFIHPKRQVIAE